MKDRPILFSGSMVRAILEGPKTQTRRIVKQQSTTSERPYLRPDGRYVYTVCGGHAVGEPFPCPYGQPGDRLWVRETHLPKLSGIIYRADFDEVEAAGIGAMYGGWKPSIFCRREHSRLALEIVSVRVERLQDISEEDAMAEGVEVDPGSSIHLSPKGNFRLLWESINGAGSWAANPWVWVVEFRRVEGGTA